MQKFEAGLPGSKMIRTFGTVIIIVFCLGMMTACSWMGIGVAKTRSCSHQVAAEYPSPGNVRKAVVYNYSCDGRPEMTYAEIHPSDDPKFMPSVFNVSKSTAQTGPFDWPEIDVVWKSNSDLWITYPAGYQIGCVGTPLRGVAVHCVERP